MPHCQWCSWRDFEPFFKRWNVHMSTDPVIFSILTSDCKHNHAVWKFIKIDFPGKKKNTKRHKVSLTTNHHFAYNLYRPVCSQNRIYFCILMHASSTWLLGLVAMGVILIGWCSHVIQVHVTCVPKEFRKSTEGLWNQLEQWVFLQECAYVHPHISLLCLRGKSLFHFFSDHLSVFCLVPSFHNHLTILYWIIVLLQYVFLRNCPHEPSLLERIF